MHSSNPAIQQSIKQSIDPCWSVSKHQPRVGSILDHIILKALRPAWAVYLDLFFFSAAVLTITAGLSYVHIEGLYSLQVHDRHIVDFLRWVEWYSWYGMVRYGMVL